MTSIELTRISARINADFQSLIDMSDWDGKPADKRRDAFLSRGLAALFLKQTARIDAAQAAAAVVDAFGDGGIDALLFDQSTDVLYVVQSKWSQKPHDAAAILKFVDGVRKLIACNLDGFNPKVRKKEAEIRAFLYSQRRVTVALVTVSAAKQKLSPYAKSKIDDLVTELNASDPIAAATHLNVKEVYGLLIAEHDPPKISLPITLYQWNMIKEPYLAYYGRASVSEVADWWKQHGDLLCTKNLRHFIPKSEVTSGLRHTLATDATKFWYLNNGITIICDSVVHSPLGRLGFEVSIFNCDGVSVVNGAQTVGAIGAMATQTTLDQEAGAKLKDSWVQVRIISLDSCPPGFDGEITVANNTQNMVIARDFAALDPVHHRIAAEFAVERRRYVYKSGEDDPSGDDGCSITEATQALGCAESIEVAVQVKREIGGMWQNIHAKPYTDLFNQTLTSGRVWRAVLVLREVEKELQILRRGSEPRAEMVSVHLNRLILHMVFRDPSVCKLNNDDADLTKLTEAAKTATKRIFPALAAYLERNHQNDYLASFSKNGVKCAGVVRALTELKQSEPAGAQLNLLGGLDA